MKNASPLEEKLRQEIDALMEENIAFLMKFTSSWAGAPGGEQPAAGRRPVSRAWSDVDQGHKQLGDDDQNAEIPGNGGG
jgi:hypothetical protein